MANLDVGALFDGDKGRRAALVRQIEEACHDPGFLCVHNTCVDDDLIRSALLASRSFFDSPDESGIKQQVHNRFAGQMKGWGPMYGEPAYQKDTVAHLESFDIGQQLNMEQYAKLEIPPNIWPDLPGFRASVLAYYEAVNQLGRAISEVMSELLGMPADFISRHSGISAPRTMRLLHYPANDAPDDGRNVGISAHTDFECFTIMHQTATGLELTDTHGQWCQAPADIGTFTIILGEMMQRLSNNRFRATGHRVINTPWARYSMILFFALDGDYEVSPLPQFVSEQCPSAYEPVTQNAHIEAELLRAAGNRS